MLQDSVLLCECFGPESVFKLWGDKTGLHLEKRETLRWVSMRTWARSASGRLAGVRRGQHTQVEETQRCHQLRWEIWNEEESWGWEPGEHGMRPRISNVSCWIRDDSGTSKGIYSGDKLCYRTGFLERVGFRNLYLDGISVYNFCIVGQFQRVLRGLSGAFLELTISLTDKAVWGVETLLSRKHLFW